MYRYAAAVLFALMATCVVADESTLKFSDYPVSKVYRGKNAKVKIDPDDYIHFRRALEEAGGQRVNFAGHYIVFLYACGGGCISGSVLDAVTGDVVAGFPYQYIGGDEPESFHVRYEVDSSLVIITGKNVDDDQPSIKTNCYDFEKNEFKEIKCK